MQERQKLKNKKSILLCGESDGEKFRRTFTIVEKEGEGASSICYEAYHDHSGKGVLKEFYPESVCGLERNDSGQLIHENCSDEAFERSKQEYIEPYLMMRDIKRKADSQELAHFIPDFEIYDGCDEDCNIVGSVYIWMPRPKLKTFETICKEIHRHPSVKPERKLAAVLSAMKYLTICICGLHQENMLHRDIKPSNFGFVQSGNKGEILTQTLSMFDINSVCSVYHVPDGYMGTEGYQEPEADSERATNQTDIYAIGATLFHALIVSEEVEKGNYLYRAEYYDRLKELVDNSKLIQSSKANSYPRLRYLLTVILQKCLCERERRYTNCEELLEDIEKALDYALPSDIAAKNRSGEKWVLADVEKSFDKQREKNKALALLYHVYEHPLYQCIDIEKEKNINVLIIGFGNYGQKFLDTCLQIGRMGASSALNVTIMSDNLMDMESYLQERKEMPEFFDGDLVWEDETERELALKEDVLRKFFGQERQEEIYGRIVFHVAELERDDQKKNVNILKNKVMYDCCDTNYVFIALGEDNRNLVAAKACRSAADDLGMECAINYVQEEVSAATYAENVTAVLVNRDIRKSALYHDIERMAFNTHLVWEKSLNVDFAKVRAEYKDPYNHDSCVGHVVAMKYWLHGMGIDIDEGCYDEAAGNFAKKVLGEGANSLKKELIWLEHSRWVTERVCQGWSPVKDLETCMDGMTKDGRKKQHICIQKSSMGKSLEEFCQEDSGFWDKASGTVLEKLDDLDRTSVLLHRGFVAKAKAARKEDLLNGGNMEIIRMEIVKADNRKVLAAFQEWYSCLKEIWNKDQEKVWLYEGLKNRFLRQTDALADGCRKNIRKQMEAFEKRFYPILGSMEYTDYKKKDADFIDHIPFILSYTDNAFLVVPFSVKSNTSVFQNVAAATVINPARIIYLCSLENREDEKDFMETVSRIDKYMQTRQMRCKVEFMIGGLGYLSPEAEDGLQKSIEMLSPKRIQHIRFIRMEGEELKTAFRACLVQRRKKGRVIMIEKTRKHIDYLLDDESFGKELYQDFPSFKFDTVQRKFLNVTDCSLVEYVRTEDVYITTGDMMALRCASSIENRNPEFSREYEKLWKLYSRDTDAWKSLCTALKEGAKNCDESIVFERKERAEKREAETYTYIIPFACRRTVSGIIEALGEKGILEVGESESGIREYATDSCKVIIKDKYGYREKYNSLFGNIYALMVPDGVVIETYKEREVRVIFDNLAVFGVSIGGSMDKLIDSRKSLLKDLCGMGFVIDLKEKEDNKVDFVYATRAIKELLTTAGKILEVYVYHKVKDSGKFDNIVSSYEIGWDEATGVKNEFDCILTKGFQTLFVECKARGKIEADFYTKLNSLAEQFGINVKKILITDTRDEDRPQNNLPIQNNKVQRERGSRMDNPVVTVWKLDEIKNIDVTLEKILDGTYEIQ